jgi:hypothetical protein
MRVWIGAMISLASVVMIAKLCSQVSISCGDFFGSFHVPEPCEGKRFAALQSYRIRLLFRFLEVVQLLPFIKAVRRHKAAPHLERAAPGLCGRDAFGTRIEGRKAFELGKVLREEGNEAPPRQHHLALVGVAHLPHDGLKGRWRDVVIRRIGCVEDGSDAQLLGDLLLLTTVVVTATHAASLAFPPLPVRSLSDSEEGRHCTSDTRHVAQGGALRRHDLGRHGRAQPFGMRRLRHESAKLLQVIERKRGGQESKRVCRCEPVK